MTLNNYEVTYREYGNGAVKRATIQANSVFQAQLFFFQKHPNDHYIDTRYLGVAK
jgi:hypothetical protein